MKTTTNLALLVLVASMPAFIGCAKKTAPVPPAVEETPPVAEPPQPNTVPIVLAAEISTLNIYDERSSVGESGRILHMPESSIVGKKWDLRPELLPDQRDIIDREIRGNFEPGAKHVEIDVYILDGYQSFEARENLRETVQVRFGLRIEIGSVENVNQVWIGSGDAAMSTEELEVSRAWVDDNYAMAIRQSVQKAFAQIKETR